MAVDTSREAARAADAADPLADQRALFAIDESGPIYLDGNSLGRPPRATAGALADLVAEWTRDLIGGWGRWIDLPRVVGDEIGELVGAAPGEVAISDATTVNLYKLAVAACDANAGRSVIVGDAEDFPTVRYVLEGIAAARGAELRLLKSDPAEGLSVEEIVAALDDEVALVCVSGVNYRSGAVLDVAGVAAACRQVGTLLLLDCSHMAGAVPLDLDGAGVDLATGCSYKYLNGGPGAPAWLYVRAELQARLRQPVWGWWGQRDQFTMGPGYDPVEDIDRFLTGSAAVLGLTAVRAGIAPLRAVGMTALAEKGRALVALLAACSEERLSPLGARLASPSDPLRRGGHLAIAHPRARDAVSLLAARGLVVGDFRTPDVIRLAPVAIYTRHVDVVDAVGHVADVLAELGSTRS